MKRFAGLIALGLVLGLAAYAGAYFSAPPRREKSSRKQCRSWAGSGRNSTWTKLRVSSNRICELHAAYQPKCAEMCRRIDAKNEEIRTALAKADQMTPEIGRKLAEAAELRAECQQAMLQHFFEISRSMSSQQGRRYLAWVEAQTFLPMNGMSAASTAPPQHDHGDH